MFLSFFLSPLPFPHGYIAVGAVYFNMGELSFRSFGLRSGVGLTLGLGRPFMTSMTTFAKMYMRCNVFNEREYFFVLPTIPHFKCIVFTIVKFAILFNLTLASHDRLLICNLDTSHCVSIFISFMKGTFGGYRITSQDHC